MKIHEYQGAELFKAAGMPVPGGVCTAEVEDAVRFANDSGYPVVLKSQVHIGGRGKAGGVQVVKDEAELRTKFADLLKLSIKGYLVKKIYVVEAVDIKKEIYCAVTVDAAADDVVIIASSEGGVEIEEVAKTNPDAIRKLYLEGSSSVDPAKLNLFLRSIFEEGQCDAAKEMVDKLVGVFFANDCTLAEINPLVIDGKGKLIAADAKVVFDDNALFRHEELEQLRDMDFENAEEFEAKQKNLSFVKLDGNIGCIVNGAGLAMATMDIVKLSGGNPDNFLDVGGSSNPEKMVNALEIILRNPNIKAILINIFGGITRCDDIANGILEAKKRIEVNVPLVIRLTGTNEEEARKIMADNDMETFSTMREAVNKVVEIANS